MRIAGYDEVNKGECFDSIFQVIAYTDSLAPTPYLGDSKSRKNFKNLPLLLKDHQVDYFLNQITLDQIDKSSNLNYLLQEQLIKLIGSVKPKVMHIDSFLADCQGFKRRLELKFPEILFFVKNKYDKTQALVGLASIIANDAKNKKFKEYELKGLEVGSGNLADPKTINYIKKNWPNIPFLRKKWDITNAFK